ncbi:MAG: hypothetical protein ACI3YK_05645 [Eubacteriales bacterium]
MKKLITCTLSFLMLCCLLAGCLKQVDVRTADPQQFSKEGMNITLTKAFTESTEEGCTACYDSIQVSIFAIKDLFSVSVGLESLTLEQYAELIRQQNDDISPEEIRTSDGLTYFEYSYHDEETNEDIRYLTVFYKSSDAFWTIQFATFESIYEEFRPDLINWANTVTFDNT